MCVEAGLVTGEKVFADGTLIKANASIKSIGLREDAPEPGLTSKEYVKKFFTENPNPEDDGHSSSSARQGTSLNTPDADSSRKLPHRQPPKLTYPNYRKKHTSNVEPFDAILIWKYSRFARNREDAIIYKSLPKKHGISVVSMNEQVDDTPAGKLLEGIIEVIDEFYSSNLAEDTIRGLKENAARGFLNGIIPIGYKAKKVMDGGNQRTKLVPDEAYAPIIKRIFKMGLDYGSKEIVKTLNREGIKTPKGKTWRVSGIS